MVVDHRRRPGAESGADLGQVVPDGDQLDAVTGRGGGQRVEVGHRGDVRRLVEHHQQRWVEGSAGAGDQVVGPVEDGPQDPHEQRGQAPLVVGRGTEVQRVRTGQQGGRGRAPVRPGWGARPGERLEQGLERGHDRAPLTLLLAERRTGGVDRRRHARPPEEVEHLLLLAGLDPVHDLGHAASAAGRREEQGGEQPGGRGVPEVAVGHRADLGPPDLGEGRRRPSGPGPGPRLRQGRPGRSRPAGDPGGVEAVDPAAVDRWADSVLQQVALHAGRHHRAFHPRMAGTANPVVLRDWVGPNTMHRLGPFGRHQAAPHPTEHQATHGRRPGAGTDHQAAEVGRRAQRAAARASDATRPVRGAAVGREDWAPRRGPDPGAVPARPSPPPRSQGGRCHGGGRGRRHQAPGADTRVRRRRPSPGRCRPATPRRGRAGARPGTSAGPPSTARSPGAGC